jgi:hypothetical protein
VSPPPSPPTPPDAPTHDDASPASSAATPPALSVAPVHHMRSRLKNDVVQPLKLFDGLIRYDPAK